jgi:hypothetical protein
MITLAVVLLFGIFLILLMMCFPTLKTVFLWIFGTLFVLLFGVLPVISFLGGQTDRFNNMLSFLLFIAAAFIVVAAVAARMNATRGRT